MEVLKLRIFDFVQSKILSDLGQNRNQLMEYTVVTIITKYINPYQFESRIEKLLNASDYESLTLLTMPEVQTFCIEYPKMIEEWLKDIKLRSMDAPNLYRISVNYPIRDLISLY